MDTSLIEKKYATYSVMPYDHAGIYGVGKAAVNQPALAVLSHTPPGATETICWAGKGIVYDTGGLSIKGKVCVVPFPVYIIVILISMFTDCHARNEEGLWWSSWYSWSISGSCEVGMLSLLTLSPSLYLSLFPSLPSILTTCSPLPLSLSLSLSPLNSHHVFPPPSLSFPLSPQFSPRVPPSLSLSLSLSPLNSHHVFPPPSLSLFPSLPSILTTCSPLPLSPQFSPRVPPSLSLSLSLSPLNSHHVFPPPSLSLSLSPLISHHVLHLGIQTKSSCTVLSR